MEKKILITTPNAISKNNKSALEKAGYIVIETKNPNDIRIVNKFDNVIGDDFFMSAIDALDRSIYDDARNKFIKELNRRLKANEEKVKNKEAK